MREKQVFPAAVEQNEKSQSLVWVSTPQRDILFCFLFSDPIIVDLTGKKWVPGEETRHPW